MWSAIGRREEVNGSVLRYLLVRKCCKEGKMGGGGRVAQDVGSQDIVGAVGEDAGSVWRPTRGALVLRLFGESRRRVLAIARS